jgi:polar amino acid transport system substrate-binding protein
MHTPAPDVVPTGLPRRHVLLSGMALTLWGCSKEDTPPISSNAGTSSGPMALPRAANAPDLLAEAMLLPGLVNSATDGPMIELLQAMAGAYTGGTMRISAYPVGRVNVDMESGAADLALAFIRLRPDADAKLAYRYSTTGYGQVTFVLYSRRAARLRPQDVEQAKSKAAGAFPYKIESALFDWGFPTFQFTDMASAFRKLEAGHIDAFLWAQEEADAELRQQGLKDIVREAFGTYDDVLAIPRGARGDFVDTIITSTLNSLRASGKLQQIYRKIHLPYDPWQP